MPITALKNLAKKHGMSLKEAEKKWDEAKAIVSKEYDESDPKYWGTVMNITKNKMKKHSKKKKTVKESRICDFETFINESKKEGDEFVEKLIDIIKEENIEIDKLDGYNINVDGIDYHFGQETISDYYFFSDKTVYHIIIKDQNLKLKISSKNYYEIVSLYEKQEKTKQEVKKENLPDLSDLGRTAKKYNL